MFGKPLPLESDERTLKTSIRGPGTNNYLKSCLDIPCVYMILHLAVKGLQRFFNPMGTNACGNGAWHIACVKLMLWFL